jgi:UDP-N-acetylglucosamine 1-carboxyvinyltransferase
MCGGELELCGANSEFLSSLLHKLRENGCKIYTKNDKIIIKSDRRLTAVKSVETQPYPGFPTDLQAQITALNCICRGNCIITENLFETRFKYIPELKKMGADITVKDRNAFVHGVDKLYGATMIAYDLRGGAALVLAALAADGRSEILNITHIDRGYSSFEYKLRNVGGDVVRVSV